MCTFIYLPQPEGGLVLGSNRDERRTRAHAQPPAHFRTPHADALSPLDPDGNGAWLATDARGYVVCLLNGAFAPHTPNPPYRMSRGRVVIETLSAADPFAYLTQAYCAEGASLEPFTLVIVRPGRLQEHRWDGQRLHTRAHLAAVPRIWSAATIYSPAAIAAKENHFAAWAAHHPRATAQDALNFLTSGPAAHPEWGLPLPLGGEGGTVSSSAIHITSGDIRWTYQDHLAAHLQAAAKEVGDAAQDTAQDAAQDISQDTGKIPAPISTIGLHRISPDELLVSQFGA